MDKEIEKLYNAVRQAAASVCMEKLPLSKEYVKEYFYRKALEITPKEKMEEAPKLVLKRGVKNGK